LQQQVVGRQHFYKQVMVSLEVSQYFASFGSVLIFTFLYRSDVTGLPLVEINRLELLALSPRDINFDLSISHVEWQLWVEEIERSASSPFVMDARTVRTTIANTLYPALQLSRDRYAQDVEHPRLRCEEREKEAERQAEMHRMQVEAMLAEKEAEKHRVWAQEAESQQHVTQPLRSASSVYRYVAGVAEQDEWSRGFGHNAGYCSGNDNRFGSTGSLASTASAASSQYGTGTPSVVAHQLPSQGLYYQPAPSANPTYPDLRAVGYQPEAAYASTRRYPASHGTSDPWMYARQPTRQSVIHGHHGDGMDWRRHVGGGMMEVMA
jgi:hypothetical protein